MHLKFQRAEVVFYVINETTNNCGFNLTGNKALLILAQEEEIWFLCKKFLSKPRILIPTPAVSGNWNTFPMWVLKAGLSSPVLQQDVSELQPNSSKPTNWEETSHKQLSFQGMTPPFHIPLFYLEKEWKKCSCSQHLPLDFHPQKWPALKFHRGCQPCSTSGRAGHKENNNFPQILSSTWFQAPGQPKRDSAAKF